MKSELRATARLALPLAIAQLSTFVMGIVDTACVGRFAAADLAAVEKSARFRGVYHVLGGAFSPIDGIGPDELRVRELLERVKAEYGGADILINAGVHNAMPNGFKKVTEEYWKDAIDVNLHAQFQLIHQFVPHFEERGSGCIVHFTTVAGSVGLGLGKQRHPYAAGKAAAAVLTKRIGVEYAQKGIRSNVIQIGYVSGPLVNRAVAAGGADLSAVTATRDSYVPRGRQGQPEEIANVAAFLCSEEASFINASDIFADGGSAGCTYGP